MSVLWARFVAWAGKWLALAGAAVLALAGVAVWAFRHGFEQAEAKAKAEQAEQDAARAKVDAKAAQDRQEVNDAIQKLPDAPTQRVGDAQAGTAAGKLRDRWVRDLSDHDPS